MSDTPELPIVKPEITRAADVYRASMEEIKARLTFIHTTVDRLKATPDEPFGFIHAESTVLQLRNVCELMAHAAIAANQPFGKVEALMDSWNARLAWRDLKGINANCFPRPVRSVTEVSEGHKHLDIDPKGLPTLVGLLGLYLRCGKLLHRGIVRHAFDGTQKLYDLDWVDEWATRIGELLVEHTALVLDEGLVFISNFYGGPNLETRVLIAQGDGPSVLVEPDTESPTPHPASEQSHPE